MVIYLYSTVYLSTILDFVVTKWTSCAVYGAVLSHIVSNLCVHYWFVIVRSVIDPVFISYDIFTNRLRPCLFAHTLSTKLWQSYLNCFSFSLTTGVQVADVVYWMDFRAFSELWGIWRLFLRSPPAAPISFHCAFISLHFRPPANGFVSLQTFTFLNTVHSHWLLSTCHF